MKIIELNHPCDHMVTGPDLENIYVSPAEEGRWHTIPLWEVAKGNNMRGLFYTVADARLFTKALAGEKYDRRMFDHPLRAW